RGDGPSHCLCPYRFPRPETVVSLLTDAGPRAEGLPGPTDFATLRQRERSRADYLSWRLYLIANDACGGRCLHRHASPKSTSRVETVHPLAEALPVSHI